MLGLGGGWSHVDHVEPLPGKNFPLSGKSSLMATLTRSWLRDVYPIWEDWLVWIFLTDHSLQLGQSHNLIIGLSFIFNSFLTSQWVWAWSLGWDYNSFKSTLTSYWGSSAYHNTSRKNKGRLHKKYAEFSTQRQVGKKITNFFLSSVFFSYVRKQSSSCFLRFNNHQNFFFVRVEMPSSLVCVTVTGTPE